MSHTDILKLKHGIYWIKGKNTKDIIIERTEKGYKITQSIWKFMYSELYDISGKLLKINVNLNKHKKHNKNNITSIINNTKDNRTKEKKSYAKSKKETGCTNCSGYQK